jgi:CRP/FNR family transcriptional regulator
MPEVISTSRQEAVEALSSVSYLSGLDRTTLLSIAHAAVRRDYESGQILFVEGETCAGMCLVQDGWLKIVKLSSDGREQILRVVGPGEVCNEVGVFACHPNPATGIALDAATVWIIESEAILRLLDQVPGLARAITQGLAERVLHLLGLVEDLSLRTVEERLARILLERAEAGTLHRHRWATQTEIAARLGTVPDVLSRALRKLADEDLIRVSRHRIEIVDREGLRRKALVES